MCLLCVDVYVLIWNFVWGSCQAFRSIKCMRKTNLTRFRTFPYQMRNDVSKMRKCGERKIRTCQTERRGDMERESTWHIEFGPWRIQSNILWCGRVCYARERARTHTHILLINFLIRTVSSVNLFNFRCQFVPVLLNKIYFLFKFASLWHTFAINLYVAGSFFFMYLCIYVM